MIRGRGHSPDLVYRARRAVAGRRGVRPARDRVRRARAGSKGGTRGDGDGFPRQAADRLGSATALQLRLFQTMGEIATEQNSTIILSVPLDLFEPYLNSPSSSPDGHGASAVQKKSQEMELVRGEGTTEGEAPNAIPNGETIP